MIFLRHFLCLAIIGSTIIANVNAMQEVTYKITPYHDLLPPVNGEKTVTLFCILDQTEILNVPLSLLATPDLSQTFADVVSCCRNLDTITEIKIPFIDDGTLRSIIYFMTTAFGAHDEIKKETCIRIFKQYLGNQSKEVINHYYEIADYLHFNLLMQAAYSLLHEETIS